MESKVVGTATVKAMAELGPETSKCCCCIPLKVACFVFGYLTLLINLFNTFVIVVLFVTFTMIAPELERNHKGFRQPGHEVADADYIKQIKSYMLIVFGVALLLNFVWLGWNLYMLIKLHMKKPGMVTLHMIIASIRFLLLIFALATSTTGAVTNDNTFIVAIEIIVTGSFLVVYRAYATMLIRNQKAKIIAVESTNPSEISVTDVYFAYPKVLDKQHLVVSDKY